MPGRIMKLINRVSKTQTLEPLLNTYLKAHLAVRKFEAENERIFTAYQKLTEARGVAENTLKTEAKRLGTGYETEKVVCEYVMPKHKFYDPDVLRENVSKRILESLGVIQTTEFVDEKILKMLVRAKKIKKSIMELAYRETPTNSPRVTITVKDEQDDE
jgi:hypothetical protein